MKLQYMIVIFAIIIIPITFLLSIYIQTQTDSISLQTKYDTMLLDATYDAIVAFQSNTLNNENSTDKDTLRDSITASINVFSNSLSNNLGVGGYSKEYLMPYVPAIAYTMYDGFYIYSPIENLQTEKDENGNVTSTSLDYEHVLKPYIYYSSRYVTDDIDIVINYSLDNYIAIYGKINGVEVLKSGYLVTGVSTEGDTIKYKGNEIGKEELKENISIITNENTKETEIKEYPFVYDINHEKIYFDKNEDGSLNGKLFRVADYKKQYVIDTVYQYRYKLNPANNKYEKSKELVESTNTSDESARVYYYEANDFTQWVNDNIGNKLKASYIKAIDINENNIEENNGANFLSINSDNDPEDETSNFVQHKRKVIKNCIEENLNNAISSYNGQSGKEYNFKMPKLKDEDWEQIYRNVSIISFLQGIPAGLRTYNNYSIVTSTGNKEYIDSKAIYFIGSDNCYHNLTCTELGNTNNIIGYKSVDFNKYRIYYNNAEHYYKHNLPACYYCMVDSTQTQQLYNGGNLTVTGEKAKAYYQALGRERYNLIKATENLN